MEFRNEAPLLFFTNTGVEQDRASARVQNKRLNGQHQSVTRCVDVVGFQQSAREFDRVRCDSWKEIGNGKLEAVDVDDDVHKVVARPESHRVTRATSAAGLSDARVPRSVRAYALQRPDSQHFPLHDRNAITAGSCVATSHVPRGQPACQQSFLLRTERQICGWQPGYCCSPSNHAFVSPLSCRRSVVLRMSLSLKRCQWST